MTSAGFAFRALLGSAALYLFAASAFAGSLGYPLDDAWIHQTLARNLVELGEWSINPGTPAAVSTAPLWTLLLTPAYLLPIPPLAWTYLLGGLALAWVAWETFKLAALLFPDDEESPGMAALLVPCEWHLIWAGFSGMETPLFAALSLAVLRMGLQQSALNLRHWGVLLTLLALTRPEGLLLGGLILVWRFFRPSAPEGLVERLRPVIPLVIAILALGALNLALSGQPLPSTLVAKNAAYSFGIDLAGYGRFIADAALELSRGPLLLLVPGILYTIWRRLPGGQTDGWLPLLWIAGLVGAYAVWLPAVYHHGRYLIPLMPLLLIYGVQGSRALLQARPYPLLAGVAPWIMAALVAMSWLRGADIYRENVAFSQKQQVTLARWISQNTPEDARIAGHDIGALGYFSQRPITDMAGLATRELTNSPKDVERILAVLQEQGVTYLLVQPSWFPPLYARLQAEPNVKVVQEGPKTIHGPSYSFQVLQFGED